MRTHLVAVGRPGRNIGFTLVELLVVIGIIALLIGIIMPALGKARTAAQNTKCLANLHTLGQVYLMYADANKGITLSTYTDSTPGHVANDGAWFTLITPYLMRARSDNANRTTVATMRCPLGYAYNKYGNEPRYAWEALDYALMDYTLPTTPTTSWAKIGMLKPATKWAAFVDYSYIKADGTSDAGAIYASKFSACVTDPFRYQQTYRHKTGVPSINAVFADGHAQSVPTRCPRSAVAATAAQALTGPGSLYGDLRVGAFAATGLVTTRY